MFSTHGYKYKLVEDLRDLREITEARKDLTTAGPIDGSVKATDNPDVFVFLRLCEVHALAVRYMQYWENTPALNIFIYRQLLQ